MTDLEPRPTSRRDFFSLFVSGLAVGLATPLGASSTGRRFRGLAPRPGLQLHRDLRAAVRRARDFGKPLLVVRIPELTPEQKEQMHQWDSWATPEGEEPQAREWPIWPFAIERGERLGQILRYADTATMAALGTTEFVCASEAEVREILGWNGKEHENRQVSHGAMLLIDFSPFRIRTVCDELPAAERIPAELSDEFQGFWNATQTGDAIANARVAATEFGRRLDRALFGDVEHAARRLERHRELLGQSLVAFESADSGSSQDLLRCSLAYFAQAMTIEPPSRQAPWLERLADLTRLALVSDDIPGARWAESGGCGGGYAYRDGADVPLGIACGMGFVHPTRSRFLVFRHR